MPTKKHLVECPHCSKTFEFIPPKKLKAAKEPKPVFNACRKLWLEKVHPGWTFGAVQGQALNSILKKNKKILIDKGRLVSNQTEIDFFEHFCQDLPQYFQDKDLQVIDSKHNEILEQIKKNAKNPKVNGYNSQTSEQRILDLIHGKN